MNQKYKIGIFAGNVPLEKSLLSKAKELVNQLNKDKVILLNGASFGLHYEIGRLAHENGVEVWGFSPRFDLKSQKEFAPQVDVTIFSKFIFVPNSFEFIDSVRISSKYRNVISTATCDAGIIIGGRWGSLNEFTNLFDMEKVIGVLTGTGGIADMLQEMDKKIHKPGKAVVIYCSDPRELVGKIMDELELRNK